jgi:hypothetical protein
MLILSSRQPSASSPPMMLRAMLPPPMNAMCGYRDSVVI